MTKNQQATNRQQLATHRRTTAETAQPIRLTDEQFNALLTANDNQRAAGAPPVTLPTLHPLAESLHKVDGSDRRRVEGQMWDEWARASGYAAKDPFWQA